MKIAICDDDKKILNEIKCYIDEFMHERDIDCEVCLFSNGEELISSDTVFDLAFIDIQMPEVNGLTVAGKIQEKNENAIIMMVTSYSEYLDDAMELNVYRYISKPVDKTRFMNCLSCAVKRYFTVTEPVVFNNDYGTVTVNSADIVYIYIDNRNITIHTVHGEYKTRRSMEWWKNKLNPLNFAQVHKSYMVNLKYVTNFDKTAITLRYRNDIYTVYCSRRYFPSFKQSFYTYLSAIGM